MFGLPSPKQKPDPKAVLPKRGYRVKKKVEKNALKAAVAAWSWREGIGHVNLSHSAMAQAATSHDVTKLGMATPSHFFAAIVKPRLSCREISDGLIQSASRIKRASRYDAILRILDE